MVNIKILVTYSNNKKPDSKVLQNRFLCIYQSFTMEVSLPQTSILKRLLTTTTCSNKVKVQNFSRKILQFHFDFVKGFFT